ncbi:MAG: hypothetical protein ACKVQR_19900 [Aquabacterium sp.]
MDRVAHPPPNLDAPLVQFQPGPPVVAAERILRMQGYAHPERVRPAIARAAAEMARIAQSRSVPRVAYRFHAVRGIDAEGLQLERGARLRSAAFESRLAGCTQAVPFVLSCGEPLGQAVVDLAEAGDLMEAVLLEAAGWLCVEDATRQFKDALRREVAERGARITSRMGPGYSYRVAYRVGTREVDWPLEDQRQLFTLLEGGPLPVTLMPSCAMFPKLSRSGLFGVAPARAADLQAVCA